MKMRIVDVLDAMNGIASAVNANRPGTPAKASFRLGLLRRRLTPAFDAAQEVIQKKVREYDYRAPIWGADTAVPPIPGTQPPMKEVGQQEAYGVPPDKAIEHQKWWREFTAEVVDVGDVRAAPLSLFVNEKRGEPFTLDPSEIVLMGDLLVDDMPEGLELVEPTVPKEGDKLAA